MTQSKKPETQSSWDESGWRESQKKCPQCGKLVWECGWWDDPPEDGGALEPHTNAVIVDGATRHEVNRG